MISVEISAQVKAPLESIAIEQVVRIAAKKERKLRGKIIIAVVSATRMRSMNLKTRGMDKVTDVLSFGWHEDPKYKGEYLGEVYLCPPYIRLQAKRFQVTPREEFIRMLTHGLLHIVGYDHVTKAQANKMFALQEKIIQIADKSV